MQRPPSDRGFEKDSFWYAVELCLKEFHAYPRDKVPRRIYDFRSTLEKLTPEGLIVYHDEPFYLACDLAGEKLPLDESTSQAYDQILNAISSR